MTTIFRLCNHHFTSRLTRRLQNTIGENFGGAASNMSTHQFKLSDVPDLTGKVAVVTGGSEGMPPYALYPR